LCKHLESAKEKRAMVIQTLESCIAEERKVHSHTSCRTVNML
jgi:hypothetical protein